MRETLSRALHADCRYNAVTAQFPAEFVSNAQGQQNGEILLIIFGQSAPRMINCLYNDYIANQSFDNGGS